jgi:hypothetical protein
MSAHPIEFTGGGPRDGETLPIGAETAYYEDWFVDDEGSVHRGRYDRDRSGATEVMRWAGTVQDPPLLDPVHMQVKVPGLSTPLVVEHERDIADWLNLVDRGASGQAALGGNGSDWFMREVRSRVISTYAIIARGTGLGTSNHPQAEALLRAQVEHEAREWIIPVTYIEHLCDHAFLEGSPVSSVARARAVSYLARHPQHARRVRASEILAAMGPWQSWVERVLRDAERAS